MAGINVSTADIQRYRSLVIESKQIIEKLTQRMSARLRNANGTWDDDNYKKLENISIECVDSLKRVYQVLIKADKYLEDVHKVISEYENVDWDGNMTGRNVFVQGLRNAAYSAGESSSYQYCLGVLTKGNIPEGYIDIISQRHDNAEVGVRKVFDNFTNQMLIQDANYPPNQTAHYSPMNYEGHRRGVYYNATSDMTNVRGAGTTYYHELAHMIDHASTEYQGNLSNTQEFGNALMQDGQRILNLYNGLSPERQNSFLMRIRSDSAHSFSDLIDATTNGQLSGSYGHSREYWTRSGNLQAEAFAHFFEASMGAENKLEMLANFFPTAFGIFNTMIESIQPDQYVRVLERGRY